MYGSAVRHVSHSSHTIVIWDIRWQFSFFLPIVISKWQHFFHSFLICVTPLTSPSNFLMTLERMNSTNNFSSRSGLERNGVLPIEHVLFTVSHRDIFFSKNFSLSPIRGKRCTPLLCIEKGISFSSCVCTYKLVALKCMTLYEHMVAIVRCSQGRARFHFQQWVYQKARSYRFLSIRKIRGKLLRLSITAHNLPQRNRTKAKDFRKYTFLCFCHISLCSNPETSCCFFKCKLSECGQRTKNCGNGNGARWVKRPSASTFTQSF